MPNNPNRITRFWQELRRRKVLPFLIGYVAACFAVISFLLDSSEIFSVPEATIRLLYLFSACGIPVVILLPWYINRKKAATGKDEPQAFASTSISDNTPLQDNSIIVLPFENISPDPDQEYFSDGLTEEIITDLSYIDDLLVISRSSAMSFKGTKKNLKKVTSEVGVRYALEGSVRKAGENIRIVAQLIDGTNDAHIWAEKYNGTLDDIFDIQEKVSRSIADALKIKLSTQEKLKIDQRPVDNVFAYDCLKRAYHEISSMSKERIDYGVNLMQKGLEVTGDNAVLYGGMGSAFMQYANIGHNTEESMNKAEEYLQKALKLDPELPEALFPLGFLKILKDGDALGGFALLKLAHKGNPDDVEIMIYMALGHALTGKSEAAQQLIDTIARIDPINPMCDAVTGWVRFFSARYEIALDSLFAAYKLAPENPMHQFFKALILLYNNRAEEAYDFINEAVNETNMNTWTWLTLFMKHAIKGDKEKVASLLQVPELVTQMQIDLQNSFHVATFYSYMEEKEEAVKWLENAVNRGFINYPLISKQDILLKNIREDNSFKALMKKVKWEWENYEI